MGLSFTGHEQRGKEWNREERRGTEKNGEERRGKERNGEDQRGKSGLKNIEVGTYKIKIETQSRISDE